MRLKQIIFIFCLLFFSVSLFFYLKKINLTQIDLASSQESQVLKSRDLVLGQPQFIEKNNKEFSIIKKHIKNQWALKNISFLKAWGFLKESIAQSKLQKKSIVVAVLDTGIHKEHPCLKNQLWINKREIPNNKKDDDNNGYIDDIYGWNFVDNNGDIQDKHGHGTHISGIIAAQGTSPQSPNCQIIGVAPNVRIMTLKYYDEESDNNLENTIKSIKYAIENGADIINYSGGGPGENQDEKTAIAKAADKNIIFVAALGNEGKKIVQKNPLTDNRIQLGYNQQATYYPASYELPNIFSVQSQNKNNEIIESSNHIQIKNYKDRYRKVQTAPGERIISTLPPHRYLQGEASIESQTLRFLANFQISSATNSLKRKFQNHHNNYGYMTGTSQATAFATGVVSLVKTLYPSWSMEKLINQVIHTGFSQETNKIREKTNQGKKLDAYEALIMRDTNIDLSDQVDHTNTVFPFEDSKVDFKNPRRPRQALDVYNPKEKKRRNQLQELKIMTKNLNKKNSNPSPSSQKKRK